MIVNCYRVTDACQLAPLDADALLESRRLGDGSACWVDIQDYSKNELESWLRPLNLTELSMQCCLEAGQNWRFLPLHEAVFFEIGTWSGTPDAQNVPLSFLCIENLLITLHRKPVMSLEDSISKLESEIHLVQANISALITALMVALSTSTLLVAGNFKRTVYKLDECMDRDPDSVKLDEILNQKRGIRELDMATDSQLYCLNLLGAISRPFLNLEGISSSFQFAPDNMRYAAKLLDKLEKETIDLQLRFELAQQDKTNRRLAILTMLSAIFLPLTLLAGIYGMNFENMPELKKPYAYPLTLLLMVFIAAGMYRYFKIRGWFD